MRLIATEATQREVRMLIETIEKLQKTPRQPVVRDRLAAVLRMAARESFAGERAGDGGPWAQLAPSTVRQRLRLGFGGAHPILVRRGDYRRSWTVGNDPEHIERWQSTAQGWSFEYGSADYRAKWHEAGTTHMPARPIQPLTRQAIAQFEQALTDYYNRREQTA